MRVIEADYDRLDRRIVHRWAMVNDPEEFWGDLSSQGRRLLKELLEGTMEIWRDEWVGLAPNEINPHRQTYRNGYYRRKRWVTALGPLEQVRVPRCRQRGLTQRMFERLQTHDEALGESAVEMLLAGVSTRRVGELLERIIGLPISAGQVSRLAKGLDAGVRSFHTRSVDDDFLYLILDAIHLKARGTPRLLESGLRRSRKRVVLVAYGITPMGHKKIIDYRVAAGETTRAWENFLGSLYRRGLKGETLRLLSTDGGGGVQAGVENVYPHVARQRCWFHKMSNVGGQVRRKDRTPVLQGLRAVYQAPTRREAERAVVDWAKQWGDRYPAAVACVDRDLPQLLAFFQVPPPHRRLVRTTNPIERSFREVRRRTRSIGTFVDDASIERIIFGLVTYFNRKYESRICPAFQKKTRRVA